MRQLLCLAMLILLAFGGSRLHRRKSNPSWLDHFFATGFIFCLAGFLVGPLGLAVIDGSVQSELTPFVIFSLGWVGFLVGMQADLTLLRQVPGRYFGFMLMESGLTISAVALVLFFVFRSVGVTGPPLLLLSLLGGACAGASSQSVPAFAKGMSRSKKALFLQVVTGLDDYPTMTAAIILFAFASQEGAAFPPWLAGIWVGVTLSLGVGFGFLFYLLLRTKAKFDETMAVCLGVTILSSGAAAYLHLAVPGIGFVAGFVVANIPIARKQTFYNFLTAAERPIVFFMFLMAGVYLPIPRPWWLIPLAVYVGVRVITKILTGKIFVRWLPAEIEEAENVGWGLVVFGPLSVAIALDYLCVQQGGYAGLLLWVVTVGALAGEAIVPLAVKRLAIKQETAE